MIPRFVLTTLGAAVASLAAASTQPPAPTQPTAPQPGAMVTVDGCLTREPGPKSSTAAFTYVLTDRTAPAPAAGASSASSGATAAGTPPPVRKMYVLRPHSDAIALDKHVNHTVRVTGATTAPMTTAPLAGRSPEATPNPAPTGPPGSTGTPFDTANLPTLTVTTLAMVADSCR